jgi:hypothetical protein
MAKAEQTPPDHAAVWRLVRLVAPDATRCWVGYEVPDGDETAEGTIPVPQPDQASGMESRIEAVLGRLKPGETMAVNALAVEVESAPDSGTYRNALSSLRKRERIGRSAGRVWLIPPP